MRFAMSRNRRAMQKCDKLIYMEVGGVFPKTGKGEKLYWSLIIDDDLIQVGLWRMWDGHVNLLFSSNPVTWKTDEELASGADNLLSSAVEFIPTDSIEPKEVVFGIPASWALEGDVKEGYVAKIKLICQELKLTPLGFVVVNEAIAHSLKISGGESLNGILMGITPRLFEVTYYKNGEIVGAESVIRSISVIDDLKEAFLRLGKKEGSLIPRVVLFDNGNHLSGEIKNEIVKYDWQLDGMGFPSDPVVEIIDRETEMTAVCLAGGTELAEVSKLEPTDSSKVEASDLGIFSDEVQPPVIKEPIYNEPQKRKLVLPKLPHFHLPAVKLPTRRVPLMALVGGLIFVLGFVALWLLTTKSEVELVFSPRKVRDAVEVAVNMTGSWDFSQKKVVGKLMAQTVSDEKTATVTGTKITGEKAKGEVTLYRVGEELSIESGTKLVGPGSMTFTFDNPVKIPTGSPSSPGTVKVAVTAVVFGTEYNLAGNSLFKVGNYPQSDIEAKNENAFSGGTRKEVSAISEEDTTSLKKALSEGLVTEAKEKVTGQDTEDFLINEPVNIKINREDFSAKVGDEATSLTLKSEVVVEFLVFPKDETLTFARQLLASKVDTEKFLLRDDLLIVAWSDVVSKKDSYAAIFVAEGSLLPKLNESELVKKIAGRRGSVVKEYLATLPTYSSTAIKITPALSRYVGILPLFPKKITIITNSY